MNNPCFDTKTRQSCPDRHCGCAIKCEKWAEYLKKREYIYKKRDLERDANVTTYEAARMRVEARDRRRNSGRHVKRVHPLNQG